MATLTRHPNEVLTDLADNPRPEKRAENAAVRLIRGRSSATTTQDRMQARFTPFACNGETLIMRELFTKLIKGKEQFFPEA